MYESEKASISAVLEGLLGEEQCIFYGLDTIFHDLISLFKVLKNLSLPERVEVVKRIVKDMVSDELSSILSELPSDIDPEKKLFYDISISVSGGYTAVESYLRDDYGYDYDTYREDGYLDDTTIDAIFNRG